MLINLSNHPSHLWSEKQKKIAIEQYFEIVDLPFPQINPSISSDLLQQLVEKFELKVRKLNPKTVHIMGELVFTFRLVNRLQNIGIPCIASTTERNTIEKNGIKTSVFEFVQFRNY